MRCDACLSHANHKKAEKDALEAGAEREIVLTVQLELMSSSLLWPTHGLAFTQTRSWRDKSIGIATRMKEDYGLRKQKMAE